ncbi:MAG TPA: DUF6790 family protein [Candidatus Dormibacteraeota bacterium]|nr:DUF6790 family protein [Candidatus Dormibacteraeota bacterium]
MGWMYLVFPLLALVATAIHLAVEPRSRNGAGVVEALLMYGLAFVVGLGGLWAASGHLLIPNRVAAMIGWPPGSPFQFEVGIANAAIGVLGILALWMRGNFWVAAVIASTVWLWGDAVGHVRQITVAHDFAAGNAGPVLVSDILLPAVLIGLLISHLGHARNARQTSFVRPYR